MFYCLSIYFWLSVKIKKQGILWEVLCGYSGRSGSSIILSRFLAKSMVIKQFFKNSIGIQVVALGFIIMYHV